MAPPHVADEAALHIRIFVLDVLIQRRIAQRVAFRLCDIWCCMLRAARRRPVCVYSLLTEYCMVCVVFVPEVIMLPLEHSTRARYSNAQHMET